MTSVSATVRNIVAESKLLQEGLRQDILSFGAVAEKIRERVERDTGSKVKESAIVMALRRHSEASAKKWKRSEFEFSSEIIMKTGLAYLSFTRIAGALEILQRFHRRINPGRDTFNIIEGNYEVSVITNGKHAASIKGLIGNEHRRAEERNLVSVSITLGKEFAYTPGVMFEVFRKLHWDNVNIFEIITTATELTLLFQQKDAIKAYNSINELMREKES